MALKMKMSQKLTQKMALTPQMRQSIHILQLPVIELRDYLEQQIELNPALEDEREITPKESITDETITRLIERSEESKNNQEEYLGSGLTQSREETQKRQSFRESIITKEPNLQEHLIRQLRMNALSETEYKIGEYIISDIDENGYFQGSIGEIAKPLPDVTRKDVETILSLIQTFEPVGIGARNLKECLIIQLQSKGANAPLSLQIIENHLPELAKNKTKQIAKSLKVSVEKVQEALKLISGLEPKPGRSFVRSENKRLPLSSPDIIVERLDDGYELIINNQELPRLRINSHYKKLLSRKSLSPETREYLKEKINSALWLIKAITQRQQTIRRISECILQIQHDFFINGGDECLKPLTLQDVAKRVGRNESTVSRVVNNKYIKTPYGIFKLNYFFSNAYKTAQGEEISAEAIKSRLATIIDEEDSRRPLSDDKIVKLLASQGINLARRTIAKYREELKIPPSHLRKK
ncbi:MAG: RNA polymerase factor sigma-54 [Candidatus Omnitrophota bacterium]